MKGSMATQCDLDPTGVRLAISQRARPSLERERLASICFASERRTSGVGETAAYQSVDRFLPRMKQSRLGVSV